MDDNATIEKPLKRDEWEIKEDLRAVKRALKVFKDPIRLKDVQDMIKENKENQDALDDISSGNIKRALGV